MDNFDISVDQKDESDLTTQRFQAVRRDLSLAEKVTRQIESMIVAANLQFGDRLPPERELAQQFGVSRTVVRQAIHSLVAKGMLEARPRGGTVVRRPDAAAVAQSLHLFLRSGEALVDYGKVHEIRRLLEIEIAGLAALRRTEEDLALLQANLAEAQALVDDPNPANFARVDIAFHAALAHATHNALFELLLDSLTEIMIEVRTSAFSVPDTPARALGLHRAIFAQVQCGDTQKARAAMAAHLVEAEETQSKALPLRAVDH
jgi:GntR family transcriptional regulator, transcriptional repressor for pyruvate dehydrogenase complex